MEFDSVEWQSYRWARSGNGIFEAHQRNFNAPFFTGRIK